MIVFIYLYMYVVRINREAPLGLSHASFATSPYIRSQHMSLSQNAMYKTILAFSQRIRNANILDQRPRLGR